MLDIGWSELLVIAIVAIVVVGPKDLPRMMRTFGHYTGKLRRAASDFQRQFEDAIRETEAEDVRKNLESIRTGLDAPSLKAPLDKPVMLPKTEPPAPAASSAAKAKAPQAKRAAAKRKAPAKSKTAASKTAKPRAASPKAASPKTASPKTASPKTASAARRKTKAEPKS